MPWRLHLSHLQCFQLLLTCLCTFKHFAAQFLYCRRCQLQWQCTWITALKNTILSFFCYKFNITINSQQRLFLQTAEKMISLMGCMYPPGAFSPEKTSESTNNRVWNEFLDNTYHLQCSRVTYGFYSIYVTTTNSSRMDMSLSLQRDTRAFLCYIDI